MLAFDEEGSLDFGEGESVCLDKAAPILGHLIGTEVGMKDLYYADAMEIGDACFRSFSPENVLMFLQRLSDGELLTRLESIDWGAEVAGQIYPFGKQDTKAEFQSYILEKGSELKGFLEATALKKNGIISVEC